ncbi:hypothetical protein LCGC14_2339550, partial [marine sediment metagenome]
MCRTDEKPLGRCSSGLVFFLDVGDTSGHIYLGLVIDDILDDGASQKGAILTGLGWGACFISGSGDMFFDDYEPTIGAESSGDFNQNGFAINFKGGDGFDSGAVDRDGGNIRLFGGDKANSGVVGNVILAHTGTLARGRVGIGTATPAGILHTILSAGRPVIFGGDALATVTGVTGTDATPTVLTVGSTNGVAEGDAVIINSGTQANVGTYWVTSVVVDTSVTLDRNASSGGAISAASVTYVNDPIVTINAEGNLRIGGTTTQLILPLSNDPVTPTWAIGAVGQGWYASAVGTLNLGIGGASEWYVNAARFAASNGTGGALSSAGASSINPFVHQSGDTNSGLGGDSGDTPNIIAGGVEAQRWTEAARTIEENASVCQDNSGIELKTVAAHGLSVDDVVQVAAGGGTLCGNLSPSTNYYVLAVGSTTTATLSASRGGTIVPYSSTGTAFTSYNLEITINFYGAVVDQLRVIGNNAALELEDDSGNLSRIKSGNSQLTISADPDNAVASTDIIFEIDGAEVGRFQQSLGFQSVKGFAT